MMTDARSSDCTIMRLCIARLASPAKTAATGIEGVLD